MSARPVPPSWVETYDQIAPATVPPRATYHVVRRLPAVPIPRALTARPRAKGRAQAQAWLGEVYGTGEGRVSADVAEMTRTSERPSRADYSYFGSLLETREEQNDLSEHDVIKVQLALRQRPVRAGLLESPHRCTTCTGRSCRCEWLSEVWLELVDPPIGIDRDVALDERIRRAVWRAELRLWTEQRWLSELSDAWKRANRHCAENNSAPRDPFLCEAPELVRGADSFCPLVATYQPPKAA